MPQIVPYPNLFRLTKRSTATVVVAFGNRHQCPGSGTSWIAPCATIKHDGHFPMMIVVVIVISSYPCRFGTFRCGVIVVVQCHNDWRCLALVCHCGWLRRWVNRLGCNSLLLSALIDGSTATATRGMLFNKGLRFVSGRKGFEFGARKTLDLCAS